MKTTEKGSPKHNFTLNKKEPELKIAGKLNLFDRVSIIVAGNTLRSLIRISVDIILVRLLLMQQFGTYKQIWLIYLTLSSIFVLGIPASVYYFVGSLPKEKIRQFVFQTMLVLMLCGALFSLTLFLGADFLAHRLNNPELKGLLRIFWIFPLFSLSTEYFIPLLISLNKHKQAAAFSVLFSLTYLLAVLVPVAFRSDLYLLVRVLVAEAVLRFAIVLYFTNKEIGKTKIVLEKKLLNKHLKYALPLGFSAIVSSLGSYLDKIVVSVFFTASQYAIYSIGAIEIPLVGLLTYPVSNVLMPKYAKLFNRNRIKILLRIWHESIRRISLIIFPCCVLLMLMASNLILLLYTDAYRASAIIFRIFLLIFLMRVTAYTGMLQALDKTRYVFWGAILFLTSNLSLSILLVRVIGFVGPAVAMVLSTLISVGFYIAMIMKTLKTDLKSILPWSDLFKNIVLAVSVGAFLLPITLIGQRNSLNIALFAFPYIILYFLLIIKLGFLTKRDKADIKKWLVRAVNLKKATWNVLASKLGLE